MRTPRKPKSKAVDTLNGVHHSSERTEQRIITQSERDCSYALRNLHQGMPPSEVIEQIAAFRSDKPDPRYYAEHTVQKALAELARAARNQEGLHHGDNSPHDCRTQDDHA